MAFSRIEDAVADLAAGRFVILAEGESGESQLCMAAELVTPDAVNFMAMHGRGLVCLSMTDDRLRQLGIPLMAPRSALGRAAFVRCLDRGAARREHGNLGARPRHDDPGGDDAGSRSGRYRHAGPRGADRRPQWGRAAARRPHRGGDRPGAAGRPPAGCGGMRHPHRRRQPGAASRPGGVGGVVRSEDRAHRRPRRLSPAHRVARPSRRRATADDPHRRTL